MLRAKYQPQVARRQGLLLGHRSQARGLALTELVVSMALSLGVIVAVMSIYVISITIDNKTVRFSRLNDDVGNLIALLTEDIKRAGYVRTAEDHYVDNTRSNELFRTITLGNYNGEIANSCILFAYDQNEDGTFSNEAFGYRLRDGAIEARQGGNLCTEVNWQDLTEPAFIVISNLIFACKITTQGITQDCNALNLPPSIGKAGTITIALGFTATLVADESVSIQATETIMVRNASYN
jgi:prepilin peptidase dependent protein B